ncbi:amidohydrolase [Oscillibacter sp.]|uniref:M20 metallopeptidase family protein n=1 Tax=Oscillibacter sp. TaxID=1945593 RepID=UPI00339B08DC
MTSAQEIQREADALSDQLITWRRGIHRRPEIGLYLPQTAAFVETALRQMGLEPSRTGGEGVTGVTAVIKGGRPGPVVLLRADMDALPLQEKNELPYRSQTPGTAHMCGHDTHTAMLLGAASILATHAEELCGSVKLMFQPGEEGYNGAARMIEDGLLENPRVDAAIAMHCLTGSAWKTGTILCAIDGKAKASSDTFHIMVIGKGTHGATPELGTDVIYMLSHIAEGLYAIRSRELSSFIPAILSVCQIHAGSVDNILPESGVLSGTFRTFDEKTQALIRRRIVEISEAAASAFGGKAEVQFGESLRPTLNDRAVSDSVFSYVRELCGEDLTAVIGPVMGAEDFSEVAHKVPSVYLDVSFGSAEEGYPYAVHSPYCVFNEQALPRGAACYAYCAMRWLEEHCD